MTAAARPARAPWVGEDEASRRLLHRVFVATAAGSAIPAAVTLATGQWIGLLLSAVVLLLSLSMLPLVARGQVGLVSNVFCWSMFAVATSAIARSNGIHDIAMLAFPVVLMVGAVLLRRAAYVLLGSATVAATAVVGFAEIRGWVRTPFASETGLEDIAILSAILAVVAAIARLLVRSIRGALWHAVLTERGYREIFDSADQAIFVHHPETGQVLDANATAGSMFGASREELLSLADGRFTASSLDFDPARAAAAIRAAASGEPQLLEWRYRRADGGEFWAEVTFRPVTLQGEPRVLALVRDVDERRQLEERTRQDDKLRSLGLLAGGVAHDFNNQLAAIVAYADEVREAAGGDPRLQEAADTILAAARRSAELTRQLLAFSRRSPIRSTPVDLHAVLDELVRLLARSIDKRIEIELRPGAPSACVVGDPALLQSAFLNLALNARDAMPDGGRLVLSTRAVEGPLEPDEPAMPLVELAISDTGVGMTPEVAARVFEPFYTTKERGTGMGLAATYGTISAHGGRIEVASEPGRGTTFTVLLPRHDILAGAQAPVVRPAPSLAGVRVLVVDDEPLVLGATRRVLERAGCSVTVAGGGREAIERVEARPDGFDAAILDQVMPGLSGAEVLAELRRRVPGLGVILVSGYSEERAGNVPDGPGTIRLTKPYEPGELLTSLATVARREARPD